MQNKDYKNNYTHITCPKINTEKKTITHQMHMVEIKHMTSNT